MMIFEFAGAVRTIYMADQTEAPADSWMGWSNGKWDGETLVVDTTGFNDLSWFDRAGNFHSEALHVVERFTRVGHDRIRYQFTVDDPATWTSRWSGEVPLRRFDGPLYEYACHEGNYGLPNILSGARVLDK